MGCGLHTIVLDPREPPVCTIASPPRGLPHGRRWKDLARRNKNTRVDFMGETQFPGLDSAYTKWTCTPTDPMSCSSRTTAGYTVATTAATIGSISAKGSCPARFGFPIAVHPHDPQTIYIALRRATSTAHER